MMEQEDTAQLDQAPQPFLCAVIWDKHERVIGDTELQHACEERVSIGNSVEFILRNPKCGCSATQRCVPFKTLGNTFGSNSVYETSDQLVLGEIPFTNHLAGAL